MNNSKFITASLLLTFFTGSTVYCRDLKKDQDRMEAARILLSSSDQQKQKMGFQQMKELADDGGPSEAQVVIGLMYYKGTGIKQNQAEAWKWYEKAADNGNAKAMAILASRYQNGCDGAKKDLAKAQKLLARARASATKEELAVISAFDERSRKNICSFSELENSGVTQKTVYGFKLRPYKNFVFQDWDLENRKKCPAEHRIKDKDSPVFFVDPKNYDVENWCQCYLANIQQDKSSDDGSKEGYFEMMSAKFSFYSEECLKESRLKK